MNPKCGKVKVFGKYSNESKFEFMKKLKAD
jgi:hypothetical protein